RGGACCGAWPNLGSALRTPHVAAAPGMAAAQGTRRRPAWFGCRRRVTTPDGHSRRRPAVAGGGGPFAASRLLARARTLVLVCVPCGRVAGTATAPRGVLRQSLAQHAHGLHPRILRPRGPRGLAAEDDARRGVVDAGADPGQVEAAPGRRTRVQPAV